MKKLSKPILIGASIILFIIIACFIFFLTRNYGEQFDAQTMPFLEQMDNAPLFVPDLTNLILFSKKSPRDVILEATEEKNGYLLAYENEVKSLLGSGYQANIFATTSKSNNDLDKELSKYYELIDTTDEMMRQVQGNVKHELGKADSFTGEIYTQQKMDSDIEFISLALAYIKLNTHSSLRKIWCKQQGIIYSLGCGKSPYEKNPKLALSPIPQQLLAEAHNLTKGFLEK